MADEIKLTANLKVENTGAKLERRSGTLSLDQTGDKATYTIQTIANTATALEQGSVGTPGLCWLKNLDATEYVEIGYTSGSFLPLVKLKPGEVAILRFNQATPQGKAQTTSIRLEILLIED